MTHKSDSAMLPSVALNASHPTREAHLPGSTGADRQFVAQKDPVIL